LFPPFACCEWLLREWPKPVLTLLVKACAFCFGGFCEDLDVFSAVWDVLGLKMCAYDVKLRQGIIPKYDYPVCS